MKFGWGLLLGALAGGALALLLFAKPLCRKALSSSSRGFLEDTFGGTAGGFLADLADTLVARV